MQGSRTILTVLLCLNLGLCLGQAEGQGVLPRQDTQEGIDLVQDRFVETLSKLAVYVAQMADKESVVEIGRNYLVPFHVGIMANRNPLRRSVKDMAVEGMLPQNSRNGTELETVFDRELMRDIDQYVKYAEAVSTYGFNMIDADIQVRSYLEPEKFMEEATVLMDGERVEEATYGGMTVTDYQNNVNAAYSEIMARPRTGDPEADAEADREVLYTYFEDGEQHAAVLDMMLAIQEIYGTDEDVDEAAMDAVYAGFFETMEPDGREEEDVVLPGFGGDSEWGGVELMMADMGIEGRDPTERYGEGIAQVYQDMRGQQRNGSDWAQESLTNLFAIWDIFNTQEYWDRAMELEELIVEFYENRENMDIGRLERLHGGLRFMLELVENGQRGNG